MIFVTGGTGLVGGYLLKELLRTHSNILALYRNQYPIQLSNEEINKITWVKGDVMDVTLLHEAMQSCEKVYHCAGVVSFNPSRRNELLKINVGGTANVVNAALSAGVKKLVHVSSVSALGRKRNNITVTEEMKWSEESNISNYGRSKFLAELEVWRGISEGLRAIIVNPTIVLGVGNWNHSSAATFKSAYNEFPWYTNGVSGFVDGADVARAMIQLMDSEISGERFILSAENWSYRDLFTSMAKAFGKKPPRREVSPFFASLVWRIEKIKSKLKGEDPLLTRETAETAQTKVYFDNSKIRKFLPGFIFRPISHTIDAYCREYLANLNA